MGTNGYGPKGWILPEGTWSDPFIQGEWTRIIASVSKHGPGSL